LVQDQRREAGKLSLKMTMAYMEPSLCPFLEDTHSLHTIFVGTHAAVAGSVLYSAQEEQLPLQPLSG